MVPMSRPPCVIEGCGRPNAAHGWCQMHYRRWRKHGDPNVVTLELARAKRCSIVGCERSHLARGWCNQHYQRWATYGDPAREPLTMSDRVGELHPRWKGDATRYFGVHDRHREKLGPASRQVCQHCGGSARHWAYDHADPNELRDGPTGLLYSTDSDHYIPLCVPCHSRFDRQGAAT